MITQSEGVRIITNDTQELAEKLCLNFNIGKTQSRAHPQLSSETFPPILLPFMAFKGLLMAKLFLFGTTGWFAVYFLSKASYSTRVEFYWVPVGNLLHVYEAGIVTCLRCVVVACVVSLCCCASFNFSGDGSRHSSKSKVAREDKMIKSWLSSGESNFKIELESATSSLNRWVRMERLMRKRVTLRVLKTPWTRLVRHSEPIPVIMQYDLRLVIDSVHSFSTPLWNSSLWCRKHQQESQNRKAFISCMNLTTLYSHYFALQTFQNEFIKPKAVWSASATNFDEPEATKDDSYSRLHDHVQWIGNHMLSRRKTRKGKWAFPGILGMPWRKWHCWL